MLEWLCGPVPFAFSQPGWGRGGPGSIPSLESAFVNDEAERDFLCLCLPLLLFPLGCIFWSLGSIRGKARADFLFFVLISHNRSFACFLNPRFLLLLLLFFGRTNATLAFSLVSLVGLYMQFANDAKQTSQLLLRLACES